MNNDDDFQALYIDGVLRFGGTRTVDGFDIAKASGGDPVAVEAICIGHSHPEWPNLLNDAKDKPAKDAG